MGVPVRSRLVRPFGLVLSSWLSLPRFLATQPPTDRSRLPSSPCSLSKALIAAGLLVLSVAPSANATGIYWTNFGAIDDIGRRTSTAPG